MNIKRYTGPEADFGTPERSAVVFENSTFSRSIYRSGTVDYVFHSNMVAFNDKTKKFLYSEFTPTVQPYPQGRN